MSWRGFALYSIFGEASRFDAQHTLTGNINVTARFRRRFSETGATFWFIYRAVTGVSPDGAIQCLYLQDGQKCFRCGNFVFGAWNGVWTRQLNA